MDEKIVYFNDLANKAILSESISEKLGGLTILVGLNEFFVIQTARALEQVITKGSLRNSLNVEKIHSNDFFYDNKVYTRNILNEITKNILPFNVEINSSDDIKEINNLGKDYISKSHDFLNKRNDIIHHLCNPKKSKEDIIISINITIESFNKLTLIHSKFMKKISPFVYSSEDIKLYNEIIL